MSSKITLVEEATDASTPDAGRVVLYAKTDSALYLRDDAGNVTKFIASGPITALAVAMAVALG